MTDSCPEALYGQHGVPNTQGKCPYCSAKLNSRNWNAPARGRGTRSITREEEQWLDSRERERDKLLGVLRVPPEQDPELEGDPDSDYYDH